MIFGLLIIVNKQYLRLQTKLRFILVCVCTSEIRAYLWHTNLKRDVRRESNAVLPDGRSLHVS